jgi:hypothetical protein
MSASRLPRRTLLRVLCLGAAAVPAALTATPAAVAAPAVAPTPEATAPAAAPARPTRSHRALIGVL